tara:strand:+ start:35 stop:277 length:243 start_codon:yes stop_codon:yes gene_type:complete
MSSDDKKINVNSEVLNFQKILFIYNTLLSGWTVRLKCDDTFEFKRNNENQEVNLNDYVKKFIVENLDINHINNNTIEDVP